MFIYVLHSFGPYYIAFWAYWTEGLKCIQLLNHRLQNVSCNCFSRFVAYLRRNNEGYLPKNIASITYSKKLYVAIFFNADAKQISLLICTQI